jgi:hypothetical protein
MDELPVYVVLDARVEKQRTRLYRVQNLLNVTRARLADLAEGVNGGERAIARLRGDS